MLFSRVSILANRISGGSFWWRPLSFVLLAHHSIHWGFFIGSQLHSEVPNTRVSTVQIQTPPGEMDISTGGSINFIAIFTLSILFSTSTARILEKELKWAIPFFLHFVHGPLLIAVCMCSKSVLSSTARPHGVSRRLVAARSM